MVIHALYDAGAHRLQTVNRPALFWAIAQAFGNFIGAGVWGFMQTLPQINMYSHGTQLAAAHGHMAFFGAYLGTVMTLIYIAVQNVRRPIMIPLDSKWWSWAYALMIVSIIGIAGSFTISGFSQTMIERAELGSTWNAFIQSYTHPWYANTHGWRYFFAWLFTTGYVILVYDLLTIGKQRSA